MRKYILFSEREWKHMPTSGKRIVWCILFILLMFIVREVSDALQSK